MSTISSGTTSTTTLVHSGDTTGSLVFKTNDTGSGGTTAMTIDTSQNVGIGTTSPANVLNVKSATQYKGVRVDNATNTIAELIGFDASNESGGLKLYSSASPKVQLLSNGDSYFTGGNVGIGASPSYPFDLQNASNQNIQIFRVYSSQYSVNTLTLRAIAQNTASTTNAAMYVGQNSGSGRSINAGGTVNASGADYAEYMTKAGDFTIAKGDICGINANGQLTNVFADAVSFVIKSTNPSYVGGDVWFNEKEPEDANLLADWEARMEKARSKVDRIAFAGQVPVNVMGATAGQYIIPVNDNGAIKGESVSNPTFEQYQIAVGKVIAFEQDGRAKIIVKVA